MPWSVDFNPELKIIQCSYEGNVTYDDFKAASVQALKLARDHGTDAFLIDDSLWEGGVSTVDLYQLPRLFEELNFNRDSKGALILPPAGSEEAVDAHFFETVCVNRGWQVRVFTDRHSAIDWLTA